MPLTMLASRVSVYWSQSDDRSLIQVLRWSSLEFGMDIKSVTSTSVKELQGRDCGCEKAPEGQQPGSRAKVSTEKGID